ncbi:hypothetical protein MMJ09_05225 [Bacillus vallismortis]|nr:hypothetical protein [Bacillus vallismortis]
MTQLEHIKEVFFTKRLTKNGFYKRKQAVNDLAAVCQTDQPIKKIMRKKSLPKKSTSFMLLYSR